jgi:hypothetical protein
MCRRQQKIPDRPSRTSSAQVDWGDHEGAPIHCQERDVIWLFGFQRGVTVASSSQLGLPAYSSERIR